MKHDHLIEKSRLRNMKLEILHLLLLFAASTLAVEINELIKAYNCIPVFESSEIDSELMGQFKSPRLTFNSSEESLLHLFKVFRHWRPCVIRTEKLTRIGIDKNHLQKRPYHLFMNDGKKFVFTEEMPPQTTHIRQFEDNTTVFRINCQEKVDVLVNRVDGVLCPPNIEGEVFHSGSSGHSPFLIRLPDNKGYSGVDLAILKAFAEKMKFRLDVEIYDFWGIATNPEATEYNGLMGSILSGKLHFGTGHMLIAAANDPDEIDTYYNSVVDVLYLYHNQPTYMTTKPKQLSPLTNIIKPFSPSVWLMASVTLLGASLFFALISDSKNSIESCTTIARFQLREAHHLIARVYSKRSAPNLFLGCWLLYVTFLCFAYECNLRAYLLSTKQAPLVLVAKDVIEQGRKLFFPKGAPFIFMYLGSGDPSERLLGKMGQENGYFHDLSVGGTVTEEFEREMIEHDHVIIVPGIYSLIVKHNEIVRRYGYQPFMISGKSRASANVPLGMMVKKDSPFKPHLEWTILNLIQGGLIDLFYIREAYTWRRETNDEELKPVGLLHIFIGLVAYLICIFMAIAVFLWENRSRLFRENISMRAATTHKIIYVRKI